MIFSEKQKNDLTEIGNLVREYVDNSMATDSTTLYAGTIKNSIDEFIRDGYGGNDLESAKNSLASKLHIERLGREINDTKARRYQAEMNKYSPSHGGIESALYENERAKYNSALNDIKKNDANINRLTSSLKGLSSTTTNAAYNTLKNTGAILSLLQLANAYAKDDQNDIMKAATVLGAGMVAEVIAIGLLASFPILGGLLPILAGLAIGALINELWDMFNLGEIIGMYPGQSFFAPLASLLGLHDLAKRLNDWKRENRNGTYFTYVYDPLCLDLDGDGIETTAANGYAGALFDHDGDGIRTSTGWLKSDDGLLVSDLNQDGMINDGSELFGDQGLSQNGSRLADGYSALREFDSNHDGIINKNDTHFEKIKVWRDLNQDGISQPDELFTLTELQIAQLNLEHQQVNTNLDGGNTLAALGSYEMADKSTGIMGDVNFSFDSASRLFTEVILLTSEQKKVINIAGMGYLRDLREAALLSTELNQIVADYSRANTKTQQRELLPALILSWAKTDPKFNDKNEILPAFQQTDSEGSGIGLTPMDVFLRPDTIEIPSETIDQINQLKPLIAILNSFAGVSGSNLYYASEEDVRSLCQRILVAYDELALFIYKSLLVQTRVKPYLQNVEVGLDEDNININFQDTLALFDRVFSEDPSRAIFDLVDLISLDYSSLHILPLVVKLRSYIDVYRDNNLLDDVAFRRDLDFLSEINIAFGDELSHLLAGTSKSDLLIADSGDERLSGEAGSDLLDGGAGNDELHGGDNADIYVFQRGHGQDIVYDCITPEDNAKNTLRFVGVKADDAKFSSQDGNLLIRAYGGDDLVTVSSYLTHEAYRGINFVFDDATLTEADLAAFELTNVGRESGDIQMGWYGRDMMQGGAGDDRLVGAEGDDRLSGGDGDDSLYGEAGCDTLDGGAGNDELHGGDNANTYIFHIGHGQDIVYDYIRPEESAKDVLRFVGAKAADAKFSSQDGNLLIRAYGGDDRVTVSSYLTHEAYRGINFVFDDATLTEADLAAFELTNVGREGGDIQTGWYGRDMMQGGAGDDRLVGAEGDDRLSGGDGDDSLYGEAGCDTLDGGAGNDELHGGDNANTYVFQIGHGQDIVYDYIRPEESAKDVLRFVGAKADDAKFSSQDGNLLIRAYGGDDLVTVSSYLTHEAYRGINFVFDDATLTEADLTGRGISFN
jgi:Ca2+-binding RTX toxin-like protein